MTPGQQCGPALRNQDGTESTTTSATHQDNRSAADRTPGRPAAVVDARARRDRIKLLLGSITETTEKLAELIEAARDDGDHAALGFASWTAYVAAEFSGQLSGLGTAERRVAVHALSTAGMPSRSIAEVSGVNQSTVVRDLRVMHAASPADSGVRPEVEAPEQARDARVTGGDGRSYAREAPQRIPRRRPLPDAFGDALSNLDKALSQLERLTGDDRFQTNREVLQRHRHRLASVAAQLSGVRDRLMAEGVNQGCPGRL